MQWQSYLAKKCQCNQFKTDPKAVWDIIFKIIQGFNAHHNKYNPQNFANDEGKIAMTNTKNTETLEKHFHNVFNRNDKLTKDLFLPPKTICCL